MKRSPRCLLKYRTNPALSTPIPWITIRFPTGLTGPPEISVFADTEEETARVKEFMKRAISQEAMEGPCHAPS